MQGRKKTQSMAERIYVALDLETTGLDPRRDAIIEIGAVRFRSCVQAGRMVHQVLERFVTFVNPGRAIPLRIQQITGIRDQDVAHAPPVEAVAPELLAFVTRDVAGVVAHNASFDLDFLQAAGIQFHRPTLDTFELASILLPGMASYGLGELCQALSIPLSDAHRALDDAEATAALFSLLRQQIWALPPAVAATLLACGQESNWTPLELFAERLDEEEQEPDTTALARGIPLGRRARPMPQMDVPDSLLLDQETLSGVADPEVLRARVQAIFAPGGSLNQLLGPHYEPRDGQLQMALQVIEALNRGEHLLLEAGTGTGKSMAYLVPAALWSLAHQRRVVVATNTIALQDQLMDKDIPLLQRLLSLEGHPPVNTALLKGRGNYLCTRRLQAWYQGRRLSPLELRVLAKVLVWLPTTESGDVSELFLPTPGERAIWARLCSDPATCTSERCHGQMEPGPRGGRPHRDFFLEARQQAERAHLLVINHALLMADIAASRGLPDGPARRVLPPYSHLVVDEAHRLEDAATEQLTYRVEWPSVASLLGRMGPNGDLMAHLSQAAHQRLDHGLASLLRSVAGQVQALQARLQEFAQVLRNYALAHEEIRQEFTYAQRLRLDGRVRTQPAWSQVEIEWDHVSGHLHSLARQLSELTAYLEQAGWGRGRGGPEPYATYLDDLHGIATAVAELARWLDRIIFQPRPTGARVSLREGSRGGARPPEGDIVTWLEVNEKEGEVSLVAAPLYVSDVLEKALVRGCRSAIFTGATLRTGSGFSFIRERLGLWEVAAATVESPFDYQRNALLFLPSDMPEPNHVHYQQAVEQAIIKAAMASNGATLVLFTSYNQLRATAEAIRGPLDRAGITVLQHGVSSRQRLLREFRQTERAVLLGTRSFWEGIDLPGDELRCLLIVRLPFAVPSDPMVAARSAEMENPFWDYTLPDAILRLRQGFGRLIRRTTDRGVVIILDSRIWRKEYGQAFLESLPTCTVRHAPLSNLDEEIRRWLHPSSGK